MVTTTVLECSSCSSEGDGTLQYCTLCTICSNSYLPVSRGACNSLCTMEATVLGELYPLYHLFYLPVSKQRMRLQHSMHCLWLAPLAVSAGLCACTATSGSSAGCPRYAQDQPYYLPIPYLEQPVHEQSGCPRYTGLRYTLLQLAGPGQTCCRSYYSYWNGDSYWTGP